MTAHADGLRMPALLCAMLVTASILSLTTGSQAGEVADRAEQAEELLGAGKPVDAFETLETAVDDFWVAAPLTIIQANFIPGDRSSGGFTRRADEPFAPGDRLNIFVEPKGYGFSEDSGTYGISLTTDIEIRTPGGLILAKSHDIGRLEWKGPVRNHSFSGKVGIGLPGLKAGDYELHLTLNDQVSQKTATTTLPFTVAAE